MGQGWGEARPIQTQTTEAHAAGGGRPRQGEPLRGMGPQANPQTKRGQTPSPRH